jgi:hypothetical protein
MKTGARRTIGAQKALREVLGCVYQARCNCVHGGKHTEDDRDRSLVTAGFVIIANLLSYYMKGIIVGGWGQVLERAEMLRQRERKIDVSRLLPASEGLVNPARTIGRKD